MCPVHKVLRKNAATEAPASTKKQCGRRSGLLTRYALDLDMRFLLFDAPDGKVLADKIYSAAMDLGTKPWAELAAAAGFAWDAGYTADYDAADDPYFNEVSVLAASKLAAPFAAIRDRMASDLTPIIRDLLKP